MDKKIPLSFLMLTFNEEVNLARSLASIATWADEIVIIDSFSTDRTLEIAKKYNARVYQHLFENHAKQWSWGIRNLEFRNDWIFMFDPDHRVTKELQEELQSIFSNKIPPDVNGLYVKRRNVFRGRWIKHGGYYPKYLLKIVRHKVATFDENEFDYRTYVPGRILKLKHDIIEENLKEEDITFWIDKHNRFACRQAEEEILRRNNPKAWKTTPSLFGNCDQRLLWFKRLWYKMPLYVRPFIYYMYRYFFLFGFLDGKEGATFHFLHAFWYRLIVDIKVEELQGKEQT